MSDPHDHADMLHKAMNRASWLQQPLKFPELKKQIKDAENAILSSVDDEGNADPDVVDKSKKTIHDCQHALFEECSKIIAHKELHLGEDAAKAIRVLAERLGGAGPTAEDVEQPVNIHGPIKHDDHDHNHPGTIQLARVFNWLLFRTTGLLKDINNGLAELKAGGSGDAWIKAKQKFTEFMYGLDDCRPAVLTFNVRPIENNEGYVVSAVVEAEYINTSHSSSTVRIAP